MKVCIECRQGKRATGSLLCEPCQDKQIGEINNKYKREAATLKNTMEKVMDLTEEGFKAKDIAEELDITTQSVYQHRNRYRKLNKVLEESEKEIDYQQEYEKMKWMYEDANKQNEQHKELCQSLENKLNKIDYALKNSESALKEEQERNDRLILKIDDLKNRVNNGFGTDEDYKNKYEQERKKHNLLFDYLFVTNTEGMSKQ